MVFAVATSDDGPISDHVEQIFTTNHPDPDYTVISLPGVGTEGFVQRAQDAKPVIQAEHVELRPFEKSSHGAEPTVATP